MTPRFLEFTFILSTAILCSCSRPDISLRGSEGLKLLKENCNKEIRITAAKVSKIIDQERFVIGDPLTGYPMVGVHTLLKDATSPKEGDVIAMEGMLDCEVSYSQYSYLSHTIHYEILETSRLNQP